MPTKDLGSETDPAAKAAVADLAARLHLAPDAIRVISVEATDWNDTSLGCPQPGVAYAQVITPGWKIVLEAQGKQAEYHADQRGRVVTCNK